MNQPLASRRTVLQTLGAGAALAALPAGSAEARRRPRDHGIQIPGATGRDRAWAAAQLRCMSLEQKIGQVFNQYLYGESATQVSDADATENLKLYGVRTPAEVVAKYHLGAATYFAWSHNVTNPTQIATLSNGLQRASLAANHRVPMVIATDQEHGVVTRFGSPATLFPGAMALGATRSSRDARQAGRISGQELRAVGINTDFAPDADVNMNPANPVIGVRSSGSDPNLVAQVVAAQVEGLQESVSACAKHFPGHGDTGTDSHVGLPVITHSRQQWESIDKPPFVAAIEAGIDLVMTAHLLVPALDDSGDPATLSKPIITGVLRGELGFQGVVVTDGLMMAGVRQKYGDGEVAVRALLAGVDMLLMTPDMPTAWAAVHEALASGRLPMRRLDEAVTRILQLKSKRGIVAHPYVDLAAISSVVGTVRHQRVADRIADDSITLLKNDGVLPLAPAGLKVALVGYSAAVTTTTPSTHQVIAQELTARGAAVTTATTGTAPSQAQLDAAMAAANAADVVLVTSYNAGAGSAQAKLVAALQATGKKVVVAALRNPYDIAQFPTVNAYLATYSTAGTSLRALVRVLVGEHEPTGKLPVAIPAADGGELYPFGAGIGY